MNEKNKCCCFTGHRIVAAPHKEIISANLGPAIQKLAILGVTDFITGGALGFDTLAAEQILIKRAENTNIRLILALPCRNQAAGWRNNEVIRYNKILSAADEVIYVSSEYTAGCMHKRNRFMCDHSSHCIFYMNWPRGGTAYTVKYALENGLEMYNIMT